MELINGILNLVLPPLTIVCLFLVSPLYIASKLLRCVRQRILVEDVSGKVVIVTGASSGIGEHLAYEYAKRGARLALVARREDRLRAVAERCRRLGSADVIVVRGDVSDVGDCKRFVVETMRHFGQLDHLVNNAGVTQVRTLQDYTHVSEAAPLMNINFWGPVYATHFAIPHLKKTKGKIVVISSGAAWFSPPKLGIYGATKAAIVNFFETLRVELGSEIGITIVYPGLIRTGMATPELLKEVKIGFVPAESAEACARGIVDGVCRGERYVAEPSWVRTLSWLKTMCPELLDWTARLILDLRKKNE